MTQKHQTLKRLYPVVSHIRYFLESFRPEIQQYFIESDTNGMPISREYRTLVYQRAKGERDTRAFGSVFEANKVGAEWLNHSLNPEKIQNEDPRVIFGDKHCKQPYAASPLNISAMSYGALSKHAIEALNMGAKMDNFAHNTGEGGVSPYHLKHGGDLIWQVGTGYFGCRSEEGGFSAEKFKITAAQKSIKMIEIKLSQGAKPGHGGILPALKVNQEIAEIRGVPIGKAVISPPAHTAFSTPQGLLDFVAELRELSGGKPVGFKLCIGHKTEFLAICKAMQKSGMTPDFITVDGSEGGTGAAPIELMNSVGTPMRDGLTFVHNALIGFGVRDDIRIIVAGKVISAFHMMRVLALGADTINSARGMLFALGCIQSRHCNTDKCPTGIATQDPARYKNLNIDIKGKRVATYHKSMIHYLVDLLAVSGLTHTEQVLPRHINRRISENEISTYAEIYPTIEEGCLLKKSTVPEKWRMDWIMSDGESWHPILPVIQKNRAVKKSVAAKSS
ncbi:UNVERIFIED_CONTAM: hypothetical protein GTU68_065367 [Idotea baltica]|nr:hypothetical protein [Idotea baltica]